MTPVLAAHRWPTNAHLIEDVAKLGLLKPELVTLDPTYGEGVWWKRWRPETLITHGPEIDGVDFRALPEADRSIPRVAYDPPYVCVGGRKTTGLSGFFTRYGLGEAPRTPAALQRLMNEGLAECRRVVEPGGLILVKCADYTWSGDYWPGAHKTRTFATEWLRLELVEEFVFVGNVRPQPPRSKKCPRCKGSGTDPELVPESDGDYEGAGYHEVEVPCREEGCAGGRIPSVQRSARHNLSNLLVLRSPR